jgi:hypothetical protein
VEYSRFSGIPLLKDACDAGVVFDLPERVKTTEAGYQHDVKTFTGCGLIPIGHRQNSHVSGAYMAE